METAVRNCGYYDPQSVWLLLVYQALKFVHMKRHDNQPCQENQDIYWN